MHADDVMADYLLTNEAARLEARTPEIAEIIARTYGREPSLAAVRAFLGVEAAFLDAAFARSRRATARSRRYLEAVLGVSPKLRDQISGRLCG